MCICVCEHNKWQPNQFPESLCVFVCAHTGVDTMSKERAEELKNEGNTAFKDKNYELVWFHSLALCVPG